MTWILVIYIYAGALAKGDSLAIHTIPGWEDKLACEAAGKSLSPLVAGTFKNISFVCMKGPK